MRDDDPFERLFDDFFYRNRGLPVSIARPEARALNFREPLTDIIDKGDHLVLNLELPGVAKENIELHVDEKSVTVSAKAQEEKERKDKGFYYHERRQQSFYRCVPLPVPVVPEASEAAYKNGVLELVLQKQAVKSKAGKKIAIK